MKVRISYTEEIPDDFRRAINAYYGRTGLATRAEVQQWFWLYGQSMNDDVMFALDDDDD